VLGEKSWDGEGRRERGAVQWRRADFFVFFNQTFNLPCLVCIFHRFDKTMDPNRGRDLARGNLRGLGFVTMCLQTRTCLNAFITLAVQDLNILRVIGYQP